MENSWKNSIHRQRTALTQSLHKPLQNIAEKCISLWGERQGLNDVLLSEFLQIPHCSYLYALQTDGTQISDNISQDGLLTKHFAISN